MGKLISNGKPIYQGSEKTFILSENWIYNDCLDSENSQSLIVPAGFQTDLASIPQWIWWWQWGNWNISAILHDYCYQNHHFLIQTQGDVYRVTCSKRKADLLFLKLNLDLGVNPIISILMFLAVCLFGRIKKI